MGIKIFDKCVGISQHLIHLPNSRKKHFSFITRRNKILSFGWSDGYQTHPLAMKYGYKFSGIHSELMAILNFPHTLACLSSCRLINVRLNTKREVCLSQPCIICQQLIRDFAIGDIFFSTNDGIFEEFTT